MHAVSYVLLIASVFALQQQSDRQRPKEANKGQNTEQKEEQRSYPTNQTIVIKTDQESPSGKQNETIQKESASKPTHDWIDRVNAFSTFIIAVFTVGMVIVIGIQIREYRTRERAWIAFLLPEHPIVQIHKSGQPNGFQIVGFIKNVGNTPAIIVRKFHYVSLTSKDEALEAVPPYLKVEERQTEYQMIPEASEPALGTISDTDWGHIQQGYKTLHVLGQLIYKDVFGRTHETRYCQRYYSKPTRDRVVGFYPEGPSPYLKVT